MIKNIPLNLSKSRSYKMDSLNCSKYLNRVAWLLFFVCFSLLTYAQTSVKGRVVDQDKNPISGVTITEKGTQNGTSTGQDGTFSLQVNSNESILVISSIGKKTIELPASSPAILSISFENDDTNIDEVLVVGYGTQSRETLTTAISKLDEKVLENVSFANPASALQGTVSGVRVQSTSGQPGAAPRVIIRGGTSINNPNGASPLYIIDGVIRSNMNDINSDDIASMQILKDAASTSIYGARGSNGVVIITTKKGKVGPPRVTVSSYYGVQTPNKSSFPDYLDPQQFAEYLYTAFRNA
ncbi:MAG: carboxypeptidase-like regulatory domain-containing protein, partial [Sphingobacterium sp.]